MAKPIPCATCRRPISADFATCPFCKAEVQRAARAADAIVACAVCQLRYSAPKNPEGCPRCAASRGAPVASPAALAPGPEMLGEDAASAMEPPPLGRRILFWLGGIALLGASLGVRAISVYETFDENSATATAGMVAILLGVLVTALVVFMSREMILTMMRRDPLHAVRVAAVVLVGSWIACVVSYLGAYGVLMTVNGALLRGPFASLECQVTDVSWVKPKHSATRSPRVRYACARPDGAELRGARTLGAVNPPMVGSVFHAPGRRGRLGVWLQDPSALPWSRGSGGPVPSGEPSWPITTVERSLAPPRAPSP